jgi:hypothetical protein
VHWPRRQVPRPSTPAVLHVRPPSTWR